MSETAVQRRDEVIGTAGRLFARRGYEATSVRDIAEALGIKPGSLYAYVESKDDLLWEIVSHAADRFFSLANPILDADLVPTEKLRRLIAAHVEVITSNLDAAAVYTTEWRHLSNGRCETFAGRRDEYERMVRELVDECIRTGAFADVDAKFATLFILSSINWTYQWYRPDGPMTPEQIARKLADLLFNGLRRAKA